MEEYYQKLLFAAVSQKIFLRENKKAREVLWLFVIF
jgi:hypothetical protein